MDACHCCFCLKQGKERAMVCRSWLHVQIPSCLFHLSSFAMSFSFNVFYTTTILHLRAKQDWRGRFYHLSWNQIFSSLWAFSCRGRMLCGQTRLTGNFVAKAHHSILSRSSQIKKDRSMMVQWFHQDEMMALRP